jgi:serine/threonine protein kinase
VTPGAPGEGDPFGATRPIGDSERLDNTGASAGGDVPSSDATLIDSRPRDAAPPAPEAPPVIPDVTIEGELGRGGMGVVYRGRQPFVDRRVAVKVLPVRQGALGSSEFVERFQREAKILASLSHPNIVACYQAGRTAAGDCFLVMELIDGPNLNEWIKKKGPLAEPHALEVVRDLARALEHALSSKIIHRDVKPENVLLSPLEKPEPGAFPFHAKLVDLGLARPVTTDSRITSAGTVVGTPSTMAPEQFDDPENVDFRADVYGLGCVLYHSLTGQPPFSERAITQLIQRKTQEAAPDPSKVKTDISAGTSELVRAMLARQKNDRPKSYEALIARTDELLTQAHTRGSAPTTSLPARPEKKGLSLFMWWLILSTIIPVMGWLKYPTPPKPAAHKTDSPKTDSPEPDAPKPDAPTPDAPTPEAAMPVFGSGAPLFRDDFTKRLEDWKKIGTEGGFGSDEEGNGVAGNGHVRIARELGAGPWRVEGRLIPRGARECGVRVDLEAGSAVALKVQTLGKTFLSVALLPPDGQEGIELKLKPVARSVSSEDIPFSIVVAGLRVIVEADGKKLWEETVTKPSIGVSLYVNGPEGVIFRDLFVRRPAQ